MKIFLTGMMGSGKSYWMHELAEKLEFPPYDLDALIEKTEGKTIKQIFEESGEKHFRKMESVVLRSFADKDEYILATGGGTPCFYNNMEWMNNEGLTIWLDEPVETLLQRLIPEKSQRPLISKLDDKELRSYLEQKREERRTFYKQAKIILSDNLHENNLLSLIKQHINA